MPEEKTKIQEGLAQMAAEHDKYFKALVAKLRSLGQTDEQIHYGLGDAAVRFEDFWCLFSWNLDYRMSYRREWDGMQASYIEHIDGEPIDDLTAKELTTLLESPMWVILPEEDYLEVKNEATIDQFTL